MRTALLACLLALPAVAQELAAPRPMVAAQDAVLRLGDLFEGAGPRAALPVGAAPAPGQRMVIEAAQLAALARAHGLPWRPLSAGERVVVERPGVPVPRDAILAALQAALAPLGLDPEAELELGPLSAPMVPPGAPAPAGRVGSVPRPGHQRQHAGRRAGTSDDRQRRSDHDRADRG